MEQKGRSVKVSSFKAPIDIKLERGKSYTLAMFCDLVDIQSPDNFDGSYDVVYVLKPTGELHIKDEGKKIITKIDKRRQSQKLRAQIVMSNETDMDDDEYYNRVMIKIRHYYPEIKALIVKREVNNER